MPKLTVAFLRAAVMHPLSMLAGAYVLGLLQLGAIFHKPGYIVFAVCSILLARQYYKGELKSFKKLLYFTLVRFCSRFMLCQ
jgi:hypothetical protein